MTVSMPERKHGRRYYLSDIPLDEAIGRFDAALHNAGAPALMPPETLPLSQARGRTTAGPVRARISSPHYDSAAMDGVAVRAEDTVGATETAPLTLRVGEQARWVDTGDPVPTEFNAVIMVEEVHEVDGKSIEIRAPVAPYQHVRPLGEDIVATELVLPEGHRLRPVDLGACAAAGLSKVPVRRRPRVAVIPTGDELVSPDSPLKPGAIVESNSLVLGGMVEEWGAEPIIWSPVKDDYEQLKAEVGRALETSDLVLVNAGSSAGSDDYTAQIVEDLGRLVVHGAAIRPGHPVVLGVADGKPLLGIPGYAVSAALTCEIFAKPLIERMLGSANPLRGSVEATLSRKVSSPMGEDEFLRVGLGRVGDRMVATPIQRGAGVITSLVRADGLVRIPRFSEGLDAGSTVSAELLRPAEAIEGTIVATGSHDLVLDLMASLLRRARSQMTLSSSNVGSLGGLAALGRDEAHMAGSHLLDEATGEYNLSFVRRYVKGIPVVVVHLVRRIQGLMVAPGNPKEVSSLEDLRRSDLSFVNRQRGSGTRVLLDYRLRSLGIRPSEIRGYNREEYTHLGVAATVSAGRADVGLGILSAANAIGLEFVPLMTEQYDLVIPSQFYESDLLRPLLAIIRGEELAREVEALGGYDTSEMGRVVAEIGGA